MGNLHYIRLRVTNYGLHFFQLDREFFCLLQPSLARLYSNSAAASPSERLRPDGSLAIIAAAVSEPEASERGSSVIGKKLHFWGIQSLFLTKRKEL